MQPKILSEKGNISEGGREHPSRPPRPASFHGCAEIEKSRKREFSKTCQLGMVALATDDRSNEEETDMTARPDQTEQPQPRRLRKDGMPDRRNGNPGNRGNAHATGRKRIPGQEIRKVMGYYASKNEADALKIYIRILHKNPTIIEQVDAELGTPPPDGTPAPVRKRKRWTCCVLESEREPIKRALSIIKDRLTASKAILESYI